MTDVPRRSTGELMLLRASGVAFVCVVSLLVGLSVATYEKTFVDFVHVTLEADRSGHQMLLGADVKLRGIIVGEVRSIEADGHRARLGLALYPHSARLVPANVRARLLPKTLFSDKFVDLVIPPRPSARPLADGDVITQDRSAVAIELGQVLDALLPLLRSIRPAELNATLNALATALEGRGERLGENLRLVRTYARGINPRMDAVQADVSGLADVTRLYGDAARDLLRMMRNGAATSRTLDARREAYAGFLTGTAGFARTTRDLLEENGDRLIRLAEVSRPTLALLARYSPEYPCLLEGLSRSDRFIGSAFAGEELHITLEVVRSRPAYQPGEEPRWGESRGPRCLGLPAPPVPARGEKLDDGTRDLDGHRAVPGPLTASAAGHAGTAEEVALLRPLLASAMGRRADGVPSLAALLFGPMVRGTEVHVRR